MISIIRLHHAHRTKAEEVPIRKARILQFRLLEHMLECNGSCPAYTSRNHIELCGCRGSLRKLFHIMSGSSTGDEVHLGMLSTEKILYFRGMLGKAHVFFGREEPRSDAMDIFF